MITNDIPDLHRPADDFRDYLEGEVIHELRQRRTFRRLRAAAVIVISIGVGMTTTLASAQVRANAQRDSLLEAAKADATLAAARLMLAQATLAQEQKLVKVGSAAPSALGPTEMQFKEMEAEVARVALNIAEIQATSLPPRDELNAPLVNGRDFVKERLQLRLMLAQHGLQIAERNTEEMERRVQVGAVSRQELLPLRQAHLIARASLVVLNTRLMSRQAFIAKGGSIQDLSRAIERVEVEQGIVVAQEALAGSKEQIARLVKLFDVGATTEVEVLRARLAVAERQAELARLIGRLKLIR